MSSIKRPLLRIATRASQLAMWQSNYVADLIRQVAPDVEVNLVQISTAGDRDQTETLRALGSFGVFTREVQVALLDGRADLAVHSLKDLPTDGPPELTLGAVPVRGLTNDALVLPLSEPSRLTLSDLPLNARIGTGSPRRQAQLRFLRPDFQLLEIRGNVETRLRKLDQGEYDAIILASAGLTRLGLGQRIHSEIGPPDMFPAVGQGAVGVECRTEDAEVRKLLLQITDSPTLSAVTAERSLMSALRAGCHAPLGVQTSLQENRLRLDAVVLPQDGSRRWMASATSDVDRPVELGQKVAELLTAQGVNQVLHRGTS